MRRHPHLYEISAWPWLDRMSRGHGRELTLADTRAMVRCGVNMTGFDQLTPEDPRLAAMVWSWAEGEPVDGVTTVCARRDADGRFRAADCAASLPFACRDASGAWTVTQTSGPWTDGAAACAAAGSSFAVPATGYENARLGDVQTVADVWLNYVRAGDVWTTNLP